MDIESNYLLNMCICIFKLLKVHRGKPHPEKSLLSSCNPELKVRLVYDALLEKHSGSTTARKGSQAGRQGTVQHGVQLCSGQGHP